MAPRRKASWSFAPELSLQQGGKQVLGPARFELLRQIERCGSITAAAQATGVSYRTAWAAVVALNELSGEALVERTKGGLNGGGAALTACGRRLLETYTRLRAQQQAFFAALIQGGGEPAGELEPFAHAALRTSARNQLVGRVKHCNEDGPQATLNVELANGQGLQALVSQRSVAELGVGVGASVVAIFKASAVTVVPQDEALPARCNRLAGNLRSLEPGGGYAELSVGLPGGYTVHALQPSAATLPALRLGAPAIVAFEPSAVLIAAQG